MQQIFRTVNWLLSGAAGGLGRVQASGGRDPELLGEGGGELHNASGRIYHVRTLVECATIVLSGVTQQNHLATCELKVPYKTARSK